jgi:ribonuclease HII
MKKSLSLEIKMWEKYPLIAGVDEAGRGALAGPLVVAVVVLPRNFQSPFIQDSKILSPNQRKVAYRLVKKNQLEYKVILKSPREIEKKNPLGATKEAMQEAILGLKSKPDLCLVDGKEKIVVTGIKTLSVIGGDRKSINIAAASIVAKVIRDSLMSKLHEKYSHYDWLNNKGYPSRTHLLAISRFGICNLHRKTYEPIKSLLKVEQTPHSHQKDQKAQIWEKYKI